MKHYAINYELKQFRLVCTILHQNRKTILDCSQLFSLYHTHKWLRNLITGDEN